MFIRRSTRIQEVSQREEADRIRQENLEEERKLLEQRKANKFVSNLLKNREVSRFVQFSLSYNCYVFVFNFC